MVIKSIFFAVAFHLMLLSAGDLCAQEIGGDTKGIIEGNKAKKDVDSVSSKAIKIGAQVTSLHFQGTTFVKDTQGNQWIYSVARGKPAHLYGYSLKTFALEVNIPVPAMEGAWNIVQSSDGWLYLAGSGGGRLVKHWPGSNEVEDLGVPIPGEKYLWDITADQNGSVYGATYPGCRIFKYHPQSGFSDYSGGALVEKEQYAHAVRYHAPTHALYAGVGTKAELVKIDVKTGEKKSFLPSKYRTETFAYYLHIVSGLPGGDHLFVQMENSGTTLVFELSTMKLVREMERMAVRMVTVSPSDGHLIYSAGNKLLKLDWNNPASKPDTLGHLSHALAGAWIDSDTYAVFGAYGGLIQYKASSGKIVSQSLPAPELPNKINLVYADQKGLVWTSGYLSGSNAVYDPKTGVTKQKKGLAQAESMLQDGDQLYFGIYPKARMYVYQLQEDWEPVRKKNPKLLFQPEKESRYFAASAMPNSNWLFFGTVPEYGLLGGAIIRYDKKNGKHQYFSKPLGNHSIVALQGFINAEGKAKLWGGTSVWGGLGVEPTEKEGLLFELDPITGKVLYQIAPVPGAKAITKLIALSNGDILGAADEILFQFDPVHKKLKRTVALFPYPESRRASATWRNVYLVLHPNGKVYGTGNDLLFEIDLNSFAVKEIQKGASYLSLHPTGTLYFAKNEDLWKFDPDN